MSKTNLKKHISIVDSQSSIELEVCGDINCCNEQVHCPLCQGVIFGPVEAQSHMSAQHIDDAVTSQDGWMIMKCRLKCGLYFKIPHYHCAKCPLLFKDKERLIGHMAKSCGRNNLKKAARIVEDESDGQVPSSSNDMSVEIEAAFSLRALLDGKERPVTNPEAVYQEPDIPQPNTVIKTVETPIPGNSSENNARVMEANTVRIKPDFTRVQDDFGLDNTSSEDSDSPQKEEKVKLKARVMHASHLKKNSSITLERCQKCCAKFHCPLCPEEIFPPDEAHKVTDHIVQTHVNSQVKYKDISILKCRLDCLESRTTIGEAHFHCPLCPQKTIGATRLMDHIRCHVQGTCKPKARGRRNKIDSAPTKNLRIRKKTEEKVSVKIELSLFTKCMFGFDYLTGVLASKYGVESKVVNEKLHLEGMRTAVSDACDLIGELLSNDIKTINDMENLVFAHHITTSNMSEASDKTPPAKRQKLSEDEREKEPKPSEAELARSRSLLQSLADAALGKASVEIDTNEEQSTEPDQGDESVVVDVSNELDSHPLLKEALNKYSVENNSFADADPVPTELSQELSADCMTELCPVCREPQESRAHLLLHLYATDCHPSDRPRRMLIDNETRKQLDRMKKCIKRSCYICKRSFENIYETKIHYGMKLCKGPLQKRNQHDIPVNQETGNYYCVQCGYEGNIPHKVIVHMRRKHLEKSIPCDICGKMFSTQQFADIHKNRIHLDKRTTNCPICGREFFEKYLNRHIADTHKKKYVRQSRIKNDEPLRCDLCDYSSHYTGDLERHQQRMHTERGHVCIQCGSRFALKNDLKSHMRNIHSVARNYETCHICGKSMLKNNLALHIRNVHEEAKDFVCSICHKGLQTKFALQYHLETHKKPSERAYRYRCSQCDSGFMNRSTYNDHLNTHTGKRPYKCMTCQKTFRQRSVYQKHLEIHSNVKFMCATCGIVFPNKRAIQDHREEHVECRNEAVQTPGESEAPMSVDQVAAMMAEYEPEQQVREIIQLDDGTLLVVQLNTVESSGTEDSLQYGVNADSVMSEDQSSEVFDNVVEIETDDIDNDKTVFLDIVGEEVRNDVVHTSDSITGEGGDIIADVADDVTTEGDKSYVCGYCNCEFQSIDAIQEHIREDHADQAGNSSSGPLQLRLELSAQGTGQG